MSGFEPDYVGSIPAPSDIRLNKRTQEMSGELLVSHSNVKVYADYRGWATYVFLVDTKYPKRKLGEIQIVNQDTSKGIWAELWSFEVDFEYRGKGYGSLILDAVLSIIPKSVPVYLCSSGDLARLMYIRRGFLMFFPCYQSEYLQERLPGRFKNERWYSGYLPPRI